MFDFISSIFLILIDYFIHLDSIGGFQNNKLALSCSW